MKRDFKKVVCFLGFSIVIFLCVLIYTNRNEIGAIMISYPVDRIIAYLLGGLTMFIAGLVANKKGKLSQNGKQSHKTVTSQNSDSQKK